MEGLLDLNPLEIPQTLKHQEMHSMQHDAMQRLGIEDHDQAPPMENFAEAAEKRVRLGLLMRQLITDKELKVSEEQLRSHVEEMCASYENSNDMVNMYMSNPQVMQQIEPMVLEQIAVDWLIDNGKAKQKTVSFTDYMNS
jgi:trigger factor